MIAFVYMFPSLFVRDWYFKNKLAYKEFVYKKAKFDCKLEDSFQKKVISQPLVREIADKKSPNFPHVPSTIIK
jgi:hypothetical protein